jgi:hypothetical protein
MDLRYYLSLKIPSMKAIIIILSLTSSFSFHQNDPVKVVKNIPPQANAGNDLTVSSKEIVQLDGTSSREQDGIISRYQWSQVAGTPVTIVNPNAAITALQGYAKGDYTFRLTVTDDRGAVSSDEVKMAIKD